MSGLKLSHKINSYNIQTENQTMQHKEGDALSLNLPFRPLPGIK